VPKFLKYFNLLIYLDILIDNMRAQQRFDLLFGTNFLIFVDLGKKIP